MPTHIAIERRTITNRVCPVCVGAGFIAEVREGDFSEDECWACRGLASRTESLCALADGLAVDANEGALFEVRGLSRQL